MKKRFVVAFTVITVLLLTTVSASAVTWGVPDQGAHPYVGTLLFQQGGGLYSCSGTLLSPTVMVTAGHCVEEGGVTNAFTYVRFEEDALAGADNYRNADGGLRLQEWLDNEWIRASAVYPHPQYDDFSQFPQTYDVGIVILSEPVSLGTYGQLPELGFLETLTKGQGHKEQFTVVGYGLQGYLNPFASDIWARYKGTVSLIELNSTFAGGASAKFTNNPGQGNGSGGSCFGDSGGPVFYGDTNIVTAVVSWGNTPCIGVDYQFRLDTATALDFVRPFLG